MYSQRALGLLSGSLIFKWSGAVMAIINWNDSLSVGVVEIDNQHKKLVSMLNDLSDAMKARKGNEVLGKIIADLLAYTKTHFAAEEKYFIKFGYPDTAEHKKEHAGFIQEITKFKADFDSGKISVSIDVMKFLSAWLQKHIKGTDQKYTKFFNDNGLK